MYVTKIGLSNIRGFTGPRAVDLTLPESGGWIVMAGRNGSGKTTLLKALAVALGGPSVARTLVPDFTGWVSQGEREGWAQAFIARDPSRDVLRGRGRAPDGPQVLGLTWTLPPSLAPDPTLSHPVRPDLAAYQPPYGWPGAERGPWSENPQGWFCAAYGPFRRLMGGAGEAQRLMLSPGPAGRMASLFHEDVSLAEGVSWLVNLHLRKLEGRQGAEELLEVVTNLLSDGLLPERHRVVRVDSEGLWVARTDGERPTPSSSAQSRPFPLREMSDGYRTVAALVLDIVRQIQTAYGTLDARVTDDGRPQIRMPGVVIIDEIDAHLHVTWQRRIGDWLRDHFPNIQFIVSSHSPYICQAADAGGLIRLPGPDEDRPPEAVDEDLYHRVVFGSGDDAAISELFGLETPYSSRAEKHRRRFVWLERKLYDGEASDEEVAEYHELDDLLTSSVEARVTEVAARLGRGE
ncbi:AAA family ATPase [Streptomyces asiaticus]